MYILGYDIGGTKIEAALVGVNQDSRHGQSTHLTSEKVPNGTLADEFELDSGQRASILARSRVPTERHLGYPTFLQKLVQLAHSVCQSQGIEVAQLAGIGLALPGAVAPQTGMMLNGNTRMLIGQNICADLGSALQISNPEQKIRADNDANLFAFAEAVCGAGLLHARSVQQSTSTLAGIGIILGTGCGGGIVLQGKILRGRLGGAGEVGHTTLYSNGHSCYCGRNGCAEQYLSGPGLEAAFAARRYSQISGFPDAAAIFDLFKKQDPVAIAVVKQYKRDLALFLGNLSNIFDPDYFVFGGGMSRQPEVLSGLAELLAAHTFLPQTKPALYQNVLGDSAGVVGAALLPLLGSAIDKS